MGGVWGAIAVGIFATVAVGGVDGLLGGNAMQFAKQFAGVIAVGLYAFTVTWVLGKIINSIVGLRVKEHEEMVGLDVSQHGERAYGGTLP
jgi:Amt family ammonium transporter